jgi:hypothetical protein
VAKRIVLQTADDIIRYSSQHTRTTVWFYELSEAEKAHREIHEYAKGHTPRESRDFAAWLAVESGNSARLHVYQWYVEHILA